LRPLCAVLAAGHGTYTIDGNEQMRKRPIGDLVRALRQLGVQIECRNSNYPPVTIHADGVAGGNATISGSVSSQFVSALLMMAPLIEPGNRLTIELKNDPVSKPYIDLTLFLMKDFGVDVERDGFIRFIIDSGQYDNPGSYYIEGDATAATYFLAAGALPGCGPVRVEGLGADSIQGDVEFTELLMDMGAVITLGPDWIESRGPAAGEKLKALNVDMNAMPDAAMTLAVMALFCDGKTSIRNIANLRVKESERIRGLKTELEKFGARVKEEKDALHITPPAKLKSAAVDTYQDHRMAMAFALAAYGADIQIKNPSCISKTYPQFFRDFLPLCQH
ncbi:MAG: 3-phosphoshikimate 1-carboxyvinyltransferase, partial [Leptospiraceae bacterium]|nr:3-phosphoshikimate 1-carboxyvinyltransferase [Leptospiraceae bacterium]